MRFASAIKALMLLACIPVTAGADTFVGTPYPHLFPKFGTLVNFDDKPTLSLVLPGDYDAQEVEAVLELEGLGRFARYPSSQSPPNCIGTGSTGERGGDGDPFGFDGTIRFQFSVPQGMVGIGIAETPGAQLPVLTIYDSNLNVLETFTPGFGLNVYAGFRRRTSDILYFQVRGDGFALDDLQFTPVPEPSTMLLFGTGLAVIKLRRRFLA